MGLEPLGRLPCVANGPDAAVDFTQDVLDHGFVQPLDLMELVVLDQLRPKAQLLGELVHDHVVGAALPQRLDDFFAPLQRAVGCRAGAAGFKLRGSRKQVDRAVRVQVFGLAGHGGHGGGGRRVRVHHDQQVELVHGTLHLQPACLRVGCMAPVHDPAQVGFLVDQLVFLQHAVDPARHGDAGFGHHGGGRKPALDPVVLHTPCIGEMPPRALGQAVVARQRVRVGAHIGGALHVVMAPEDVGAATRLAHIAQRQLQDA